jgi:low temperature requirement protein LtrA
VVIVALGETIVVTGATLAHAAAWNAAVVAAFASAFVGSVALWWIYFDAGRADATARIRASDNPGLLGARFHYVHVALVGGIIVSAVGNDLALAHPHAATGAIEAAVLVGGPALYLAGSLVHKVLVYGRAVPSHFGGLALLAGLAAIAGSVDLLAVGALSTAILCAVAAWDAVARRRR